jgi:hypothetical protein
VIGAGKWQMGVLSNGLSLVFKKIARKYREQNNMSAVKNMPVLKGKVKNGKKKDM